MKRRIIIFWILSILFFSVGIPMTTSHMYMGRNSIAIDKQISPLYVSHDAIEIIGNDNFTAANGVIGGNGTKDNPYIIAGWDIGGSNYYYYDAIYIKNTTAYFIIKNCNIHKAYYGIYLLNVHNGTIINNIIYYGANIFISNSSNIVIADNSMGNSNTPPVKVKIVFSSNISLYNNTITTYFPAGGIVIEGDVETYTTLNITTNNTINGKPVYYYHNVNMHNATVAVSAGEIIIGNVSYLKIKDSTVGSGSYYGIIVGYSSHVSILNSSVGANQGRTIDIYNSDNLTLSNLTLSGEYYGIYTYFCNNSYFSNITFYTGGVRYYRGIYMINSSKNIIYDNHAFKTSEYAIYMENSTLNTVLSNYISTWDGYGIYMTKSSNQNVIKNNTIVGSSDGIRLISSNWNVIENNDIRGESNIVRLINSSNNKIIADTIHGPSNNGIVLESESNNNIIMNCTLYNNSGGDIDISHSTGNVLYGNDMYYGGYGYTGITLWGDLRTYATQTISSNNTVNGKSVYYYKNSNMNNASVPNDAGEVILGNVSFLNISNVSTNHLISSVIIGYSSHINVNNVSIYYGHQGIRIYYSSNCTLLNSTVEHDNWIGAYVLYSKHILLKNNTMDYSGNPWEAVILLKKSSYVTVTNDILNKDYYKGIWAESSNNVNITNNTISNIYSVHETGYKGVYIQNSQVIFVSGNDMYKNYDSIVVFNSTYTEVTGNIVHNNTDKGIIIQSCNGSYDIEIEGNTFYGNPAGVYIDGSSLIYIYDNSAYSNKNGIYIHRSNKSIIKNNYIHNNTKNGILVSSSSQNKIYNNTVYGNERGIQLTKSSTNNTIFKNDIYRNIKGIYVYDNSTNNTILKNKFDNNSMGAIWIHNSTNDNVYENFMHYDDIILYGDIKTFTTQNIPVNNTVNGNPVYYYWNKDMKNSTAPLNAGEIILGNVTYFKVESTSVGYTTVSILIGYSSNINTSGNYIYNDTLAGIYLYRSGLSSFTKNKIYGNNIGVYVRYCNISNIMKNNDILNNIKGLYFIYSNNNSISGNNLTDNDYGIYLDKVTMGESVKNNSIHNNHYGVYLYKSKGNNISMNMIYNNTNGVFLKSANNNNISKNSVNANEYGIYLYLSNQNLIYNNTLKKNENGIYLFISDNNLMILNKINNNTNGISLNLSSNNNLSKNLVTKNHYGLYLYLSDSNDVEYNKIKGCTYGIYLYYYSYYNNIGNNTIYDGAYGIYFKKLFYIEIYNNTISSNSHYGIFGIYSTDTNGGYYGIKIIKNRVYDNLQGGIVLYYINWISIKKNDIYDNSYGISTFGGLYAKIENNIIHNNTADGIRISSDVNLIINNIIYNNCGYGLNIDCGSKNKIYNNSFYYNNGAGDHYNLSHIQARDVGYIDYWNSTSGVGNYWYDWANNNDTNDQNSDGIVDWPYTIIGGKKDYYPLKNSYTSMPPLAPTQPRNLKALAGNGYVYLSWSTPLGQGSSPITGYKVYRDGVLIAILSANQLWYNDTSVNNGITYTYYVTAINSIGESCKSNKVQATPGESVPELQLEWVLVFILLLIVINIKEKIMMRVR